MKYLIYLGLICLCACSFKSEDSASLNTSDNDEVVQTQDQDVVDFKLDSDGDLILDRDEKNQGTNPLISNFPELRVRFLQNYKIQIDYLKLSDGKEGSYVIDTSVRENDPSFQYRIGEVFLKNESVKNSALIAQYSNHTWGDIVEHDLSWVTYPSIDQKFYLSHVLKATKYFDESVYEIKNISISLKNSARLKEGSRFTKVRNLVVNYLYYDYEREFYEVINSRLVEREFSAGINETFEVVIDSAPINLIKENFLKKGEFIISELSDYDIPDLGVTYKTLLSSVREKTLPVLISTPLNVGYEYVSFGKKGRSINEILAILYADRFRIENDELTKIAQFENNLPQFQYLNDLAGEDKKGKWFVFTNKLTSSYLQHFFTNSDVLSLSYVMGNDLAREVDEKVFSFRDTIDSTNPNGSYPLGNVKSHSLIHFQVKTLDKWGERRNYWKDRFHADGASCGRNCVSSPFNCDFEVSLLEPYRQSFSLANSGDGEMSKLKLIINGEGYSLVKLINEKLVKMKFLDSTYHFEIPDLSKIAKVNDFDENLISLKLEKDISHTFIGVKLLSMEGGRSFMCPGNLVNMAGTNGWPVSVDSFQFNQWQGNVRWDRVQKGTSRDYEQNFSLSLSSTISNFFN